MNDRSEMPAQHVDEVGVQKWLTIPGRLLLIVSIMGTTAGFIWLCTTTWPNLPPGRYPVIAWVIPPVVGGAISSEFQPGPWSE